MTNPAIDNCKSDLKGVITPISALLEIYLKAQKDCYMNYMEGWRTLVEWLIVPNIGFSYNADLTLKFGVLTESNVSWLNAIGSYETNHLAKTINNVLYSGTHISLEKHCAAHSRILAELLNLILKKEGLCIAQIQN